jgi:hypothetical protein
MDRRTVQVSIGKADGLEPSQKNWGDPHHLFAADSGFVTVDVATGDVHGVSITGPMLTPTGRRHATRTGRWAWLREPFGRDGFTSWPPAGAPPAAVAVVDRVRAHLNPSPNPSTRPPAPAAARGPAYAWGQLLAVYGRVAELAGAGSVDEHSKLLTQAFTRTTVRPGVVYGAERWFRRAETRRPAAEAAATATERAALAARAVDLAEASDGLQSPYLTMVEREQVMFGYHHEHARLSGLALSPEVGGQVDG